MKTFSRLFRLSWFDLTWQLLEEFGFTDGTGGEEYCRVLRDWTRLGYPLDTLKLFALANVVSDGKTVPQNAPGSTNEKPRG